MPWRETLTPDDYQYRYRVRNGSGKYKLKLFVDEEQEPRQVSSERDAMDQVGNVWEFTVPPRDASGQS